MKLSSRDEIAYSGADSGCKAATQILGGESSCLHCPFPECSLDNPFAFRRVKKRNRDKAIVKRRAAGAKIRDLVKEFGITRSTVRRALRDNK